MSKHFNGLTPSEAELLAILAEEAGEIVQAIGKILRHGYESCNPAESVPRSTNRQNLEREIGDFDAVCALLIDARTLHPGNISIARQEKCEKLKRWTHHQGPRP